MKAIKPPADKVNAMAVHEAGHAVIALVLRRPISGATIQRDGHAGFVDLSVRRPRVFRATANGVFVNVEQEKRRTHYRTDICVLLAGRAAEELLLPDLAIQDSDSDRFDRTVIAKFLPLALSPQQSEAQLLETLEQQTRTLVRTYRDVIVLLAALLVSNTSLTGAQIRLACRTPIRIAREDARAVVERLKRAGR